MLNLDKICNNKSDDENWPFRMLIIGPSGSGKTKELFIRCRKLNISIVFITQSYFRTPKDARLNSTHYVIMKIQSIKELQNIAQDNSGDIDFKGFLKTYKDYTSEPYSCMIINTTVPSVNPMRFRNNF